MGLLDGFEKLINEHGSAAILRERIDLANDKYASLERKAEELNRERDDARARLSEAEARIRDVEAQIAKMATKVPVSADAVRVLRQFVEQGRELTAHQIADVTGMGLGEVIHHLGSLRSIGFVQQSRAKIDDSEPPHRVTHKGSAFLADQG